MNKYVIALILLLLICSMPVQVAAYDIRNGVTIELREIQVSFSTQALPVSMWVYCLSGVTAGTPGECAKPTFPSPVLELGAGQAAAVTLDLTTNAANIPNESTGAVVNNFLGHTIHFAGLDLPQAADGVPNGLPPTNIGGDVYSLNIGSEYVGSHAYYCHVHQTKHLEMGEFGAFIVRPVDAGGQFLNQINQGGPQYQVEANFLLNTIDPSYHFLDIVGEDPVFANYNPAVFLVNGAEGLSATAPAVTVSATVNDVVAIRLIGMHSVNATFQVVDSVTGNVLGTPQSFELHNMDGFKQVPQTLTSVEISPGQTKDILLTLPATSATWYPVVTYKALRDDAELATVYSQITF